MNLDSKWKESVFETSDIFLALVFGIAFQQAISNAIYFIAEIEVPFVAGISIIAIVLKKYRRSSWETFSKLVLRGARWILGIWAGLLFATGYSLVTLFPAVGIPVFVFFFVVVLEIIHYFKVVEKKKEEPDKKTT